MVLICPNPALRYFWSGNSLAKKDSVRVTCSFQTTFTYLNTHFYWFVNCLCSQISFQPQGLSQSTWPWVEWDLVGENWDELNKPRYYRTHNDENMFFDILRFARHIKACSKHVQCQSMWVFCYYFRLYQWDNHLDCWSHRCHYTHRVSNEKLAQDQGMYKLRGFFHGNLEALLREVDL